jgi:hypothetical protein
MHHYNEMLFCRKFEYQKWSFPRETVLDKFVGDCGIFDFVYVPAHKVWVSEHAREDPGKKTTRLD